MAPFLFIYLLSVIVWAVLVKIFWCFFTEAVNLGNVCYIQMHFLFYIFFIYCIVGKYLLGKSNTVVHRKRICTFVCIQYIFCIAFKSSVHICSLFLHICYIWSQVKQGFDVPTCSKMVVIVLCVTVSLRINSSVLLSKPFELSYCANCRQMYFLFCTQVPKHIQLA